MIPNSASSVQSVQSVKVRDQIFAAVPRYEDAELELFGQKFPVRVLLVSMAEFNARMKVFGTAELSGIAAEISGWFFDAEGNAVFTPEDLDKLPAAAVQHLMQVFTRVNTGTDSKNA